MAKQPSANGNDNVLGKKRMLTPAERDPENGIYSGMNKRVLVSDGTWHGDLTGEFDSIPGKRRKNADD